MRAAASRTFCTAGRSRPISTAMMAMTTSNSISVNPRRERMGESPSMRRINPAPKATRLRRSVHREIERRAAALDVGLERTGGVVLLGDSFFEPKAGFARDGPRSAALFIVRIDADFIGRRSQPLVAGDLVPSVLNDRSRHGAVVLGRMEFDSSLIQRLAFERHGARKREPRITRTAAGDKRGYESHRG